MSQPGTILHEPECLTLATRLLQRMRLARPEGGIWEAADVQWWSRSERLTDRDGQLFWLDDRGDPVAAVLRTSFGDSIQCDVLALPGDPSIGRPVWLAGVERVGALGGIAEFPVRVDDAAGIAALTADRTHPIAARNGPQAEGRLRQCSLYRADLDLMVEAPGGEVAGYGLFWADPVTGVGLVEPMRTEAVHQGRGIASHLLAAGLERLAAHGCTRLKVSNDIGLYLRAGFRALAAATAEVYGRAEG